MSQRTSRDRERNPVTWGKELRAQSKARNEPMFCLAYNCELADGEGSPLGESVYYVGTADPELFKEIKDLIFGRLRELRDARVKKDKP